MKHNIFASGQKLSSNVGKSSLLYLQIMLLKIIRFGVVQVLVWFLKCCLGGGILEEPQLRTHTWGTDLGAPTSLCIARVCTWLHTSIWWGLPVPVLIVVTVPSHWITEWSAYVREYKWCSTAFDNYRWCKNYLEVLPWNVITNVCSCYFWNVLKCSLSCPCWMVIQ